MPGQARRHITISNQQVQEAAVMDNVIVQYVNSKLATQILLTNVYMKKTLHTSEKYYVQMWNVSIT